MIRFVFRLCVLAAAVLLAPRAYAEGICAKAAAPEAQSVCRIPAFSDIEAKIDAAYAASAQRLTTSGQTLLKQTQDQWEAAVIAGCDAVRDDPARLPACLQRPYTMRLDDLIGSVRTIGGFTFQRVSRYAFAACLDDPDCEVEFGGGYLHASHPRIDAPANDQTQAWNQLINGKLPPLALQPNVDATLDFRIIGVSADMISVRLDLREDAHRSGQGSSFAYLLNVLLSDGRQVEPQDLFATGVPWQAYLVGRATPLLGGTPSGGANPIAVSDIVADPARWAFTPAGLSILFRSSDLGFPEQAPMQIVIPWADLKPYLRDPLPFSLPQ